MIKDFYANMAYIAVTESAANTLTTQKLESGYSVLGNRGWVIHRIDYYIGDSLSQCADNGDTFVFGICTQPSTAYTTWSVGLASVIDFNQEVYYEQGTPANFLYMDYRVIRDFTELPGGGLIVAPNPLYLATKGTGLAAAGAIQARIFFSEIDLDADMYRELFQARTLVS